MNGKVVLWSSLFVMLSVAAWAQTGGVSGGFVKVPAGTFMMGSPASEAERQTREGPQRRVTLSAFYIGRCEVTQKEYLAVMGSNPSCFQGENLPVESVSWFDAVKYCNAQSERDGLVPTYTINGEQVTWNRRASGYRLLTEAEWEYACRAGTTTPFSTGSNITTQLANYDGNSPYNNSAKGESRQMAVAVGRFAPNAWGLYDMHGNVWEWCWDWYASYTAGNPADPPGPSSGVTRILRGGSWYDSGQALRSATRGSDTPVARYYNLGFRIARSCF